MPKAKTRGVVKVSDRNYAVDVIRVINGARTHIRKGGFATVQEAKEALDRIVEGKRERACRDSVVGGFDGLFRKYFDFRGVGVKPQTNEARMNMMRKHALSYFGNANVEDALSVDNVSAWYKKMLAKEGLGSEQKNRVFSEMRGIIDRAFRWKCITAEEYQDVVDVIRNIPEEKKEKREVSVWTMKETRKFLDSIPKDSIDYPMFSLFCYLGCRLGEFLALQWKCLDEGSKSIAIRQQIVYRNGNAVLSNELKTNESYRVNSLDDDTFDLLMRYKATLNDPKGDDFIFPSPIGGNKPYSRTEFRRKFYARTKKAGLPKIVPHGVRHAKATELASVCEDTREMAVAAKFLGHSPSMFINTYVNKESVSQADLINRIKTKDA